MHASCGLAIKCVVHARRRDFLSFFILLGRGGQYKTQRGIKRKKREQVLAAQLHSYPPVFSGVFMEYF
jgi:hypothetical protein